MNSGILLRALLLVIFITLLFAAYRFYDMQQGMLDLLSWIERAGPGGPLIFFGLYILAGVFVLPGLILNLGAGALFGVVKGSLIVYFSATASATAAFLIGRYLARDVVTQKMAGNRTFFLLDRAVGSDGWKIVGLTRLSPLFPYNVLNYAFGLTRVSLKDYVLASFFGMMPLSTVYVYLGSLAGSLAELGTEGSRHSRTAAEWAVYVVGLIATVVLTVVITRIARRALRERIPPQEDKEMKL
ncbi:MAG: TVP38/TMEM64 family protein [Acidobacteriota bacterium]